MDKTDLLDTLLLLRETAVFGAVVTTMVKEDPLNEQLASLDLHLQHTTEHDRAPFDVGWPDLYLHLCEKPERFAKVIIELNTWCRQTLVSSLYEVVFEYCERSRPQQTQRFAQQPWYQFLKLLRHSASHYRGGVLRYWPPDLRDQGVHSVAWRHRTIDQASIGNMIRFDTIDCLELWEDVFAFVRDEL